MLQLPASVEGHKPAAELQKPTAAGISLQPLPLPWDPFLVQCLCTCLYLEHTWSISRAYLEHIWSMPGAYLEHIWSIMS